MSTYGINEHKHRFAAWAASRAASTSTKCRFEVAEGRVILEAVGLNKLVGSLQDLPSPNEIDKVHKDWRVRAIEEAKHLGKEGFSHGVAAKLINVYLKSVFVCSDSHDDLKVKALHPPIDRVLLEALKKNNPKVFKSVFGSAIPAWSTFDSDSYEKAIAFIRDVSGDNALWMIEEHWVGHQ